MKEVRNLIWVLKPKWKDEDKQKEDYEEENENVKEAEDKEGKKKDKVVPTFGGAICVDKSGLLLTTVTGLTGSKKPKLRKAMVRARCYRGYFRDVKLVKDSLEDGLALYQVVKKAENEVFEFLDFDEVKNVELTVLDKVVALVHTGGNFSFRRGILNFPPPPIPPRFPIFRIFKDSSFENYFPYLNHHLPLLQVSNLGDIMNSGMSGCPVFKMENSEFLGLIAFCTGKFSLVIPLRIIRHFICSSQKRKREDDDDDSNDMKLKKRRGGGGGGGGQGRGGKGGGGGGRGGGGGWRGGKGGGGGGKGRGGGGGWRGGKGGGGGKGRGQGWRGGKGRGGGGVYAYNSANPFIATVYAKAFILLQNVPPAVLVQFFREHRSEWADFSVDAYSAAVLKANTCAFPGIQAMRFSGNQIIMLLGHTIEHEEDNPTNRTLDLTSSPEVGPPTNQGASDVTIFGSARSVLTIVFQLLPFESNFPESDATMARQYVRSVISSVQRVAMAITPPDLTPTVGPKLSPGSPDALILVHWICKTYRRPNDAIDGFSDDGWTLLNCEGAEGVIIAFNAAKAIIATLNGYYLLPVVVVLCAKASMLLQNVPPTVLVRLLREHRSEWADVSVSPYSAAALKANLYAFPGMRATRFSGSQKFMPLDHTIEHEKDNLTNRTLDLTLSLEVGPPTNQGASDAATSGSTRSVLSIAFQLLFDSNLQESVATMANQYVRSVISSVQRVAMAVTPSGLTPTVDPKLSLGSLEALTLVHWICKSYCCHMGIELLQTSSAID